MEKTTTQQVKFGIGTCGRNRKFRIVGIGQSLSNQVRSFQKSTPGGVETLAR